MSKQKQQSPTPPDRAISINEPFAWACAAGLKTIENRSWATDYRGPIAIHASTAMRHLTPENEQFLADAHGSVWASLDNDRIGNESPLWYRGAIIGMVEIVDCVQWLAGDDPADLFSRFTGGSNRIGIPHQYWAQPGYCFVLANARRFRHPIPARGALNIWRLTTAQQAAIAAAMLDTIDDPGEPATQPAGWIAGAPAKLAEETQQQQKQQQRQPRKPAYAKRRPASGAA